MPALVTLDDLEKYRAEKYAAERDGRIPKYKDPREVYAEDPNLDSYLVEKTEAEIKAEKKARDKAAAEKKAADAAVAKSLEENVQTDEQNSQVVPPTVDEPVDE